MIKKQENTHRSKYKHKYKVSIAEYPISFSSRIMDIQVQMCERALELLCLPEDEPCHILDIGCGSGLSGSVLEENGHSWVGIDISPSMLGIYCTK